MADHAAPRTRSWTTLLLWLIGIAVALFVVIQFVPYGRGSHSDPPATNAFTWTDPQAKAIAKASCYDCHSNQTRWWWATDIAPFSWLVQHDVDQGRARLNFSDWAGYPSASRFAEVVNDGRMPPFQYSLIHPHVRLTAAQKQTLIQGYAAGARASGGGSAATGGSGASSGSTGSGGGSAAATAAIEQDCGSCHAADPALAFRASSTQEAQALIQQMVQRGASVSSQDAQLMIQYWTR